MPVRQVVQVVPEDEQRTDDGRDDEDGNVCHTTSISFVHEPMLYLMHDSVCLWIFTPV
jgi:hypothetical protein